MVPQVLSVSLTFCSVEIKVGRWLRSRLSGEGDTLSLIQAGGDFFIFIVVN